MRWYENPAKHCVTAEGEPIEEYSDLALLKNLGYKARVQRKKELVNGCLTCPVLKECREDLLSSAKHWEHWGIQAGVVGR